jgi:hypothetical protein
MSSFYACNVTVRERWGGLGKGRGKLGVGVGSIASTRDKCGRAFAPRASKGGFPSKLKRCIAQEQGRVQGEGAWGIITTQEYKINELCVCNLYS